MKPKLVHHNILVLTLVSLQGITQVSGCFSKQETRAQLKRLSGAHPELAKDTQGFNEAYLRRISKLSPLAQLKVQFCQKLIEGRSSMLQGLGNVVNCNEVYERMGLRGLRDLRDRKFRPGHNKRPRPQRKKRRKPNSAVITEVSNFVEEDVPVEIIHEEPEANDEGYFYEDIPEDEGFVSEGPWTSSPDEYSSVSPPVTGQHGTTGDNSGFKQQTSQQPITPVHNPNLGYQYEISHPQTSGGPSGVSGVSGAGPGSMRDTGEPIIRDNVENFQTFVTRDFFQQIPTTSQSPAPLPANVHWEPSSYENWESDEGSKTKTESSSDKAFNTFSWPSNTWGANNKGASGGDSQWMKDVRSQVKRKVQSKVQTTSAPLGQQVHTWTPTSAWAHNTWSTSTSVTSTRAAARVATSQSVLAAPSEPTRPLEPETAVTWASSDWPGDGDKYSESDVMASMGPVRRTTTRSPTDRKLIRERDEVLSRNYFFTPSPQPLHVRDRKVAALKPQAQFGAEFSAFNNNGLDRFDTNFRSEDGGVSGRLKKEIKTSDKADTFFQLGHPVSNQERTNVASTKQKTNNYKRKIHVQPGGDQATLPDPLAPGHPQGNGNHGWAPIEEWATAHITHQLDSPDWAHSQVFPSPPGRDWSDRMSAPLVTPGPSVIRWSSPAPVIYQSSTLAPSYVSPTARSFQSPAPFNSPAPLPFKSVTPTPFLYSASPSSTVTTVAPSEVSTMRHPSTMAPVTPMAPVFGSPVTPMYHTQYRDMASLADISSGPTGPPGLQLFKGPGLGVVTGQTGASGLQPVPHSNSHYVEQNPFLVSPQPPGVASVTAATASAVKRNIVSSLYNYNPSDRSPGASDVTPSPSLVSPVTSPSPSSKSGPAGFSYNNMHWPKSGVSTGYNNIHY